MGLLLKDRDYVPDDRGGVATVSGGEAVMNEALFRLAARRGSFPLMPELGSQMEALCREKPSTWQSLAKQYAAEALSDLEDVSVTDAAVTQEGDSLTVAVSLLWEGETLEVTTEVDL
jgi:hypothetical protein